MAARLLVAFLALSAWIQLLFLGFDLGGGVHLLLVASLALFPWRSVPRA